MEREGNQSNSGWHSGGEKKSPGKQKENGIDHPPYCKTLMIPLKRLVCGLSDPGIGLLLSTWCPNVHVK